MGWDLLVVVGCVVLIGVAIVFQAQRRRSASDNSADRTDDVAQSTDSDGGGD